MSEETYTINISCENCGYGNIFDRTRDIEIKKGTKVEAHLKDKKCPKCGCKTLRHREVA